MKGEVCLPHKRGFQAIAKRKWYSMGRAPAEGQNLAGGSWRHDSEDIVCAGCCGAGKFCLSIAAFAK